MRRIFEAMEPDEPTQDSVSTAPTPTPLAPYVPPSDSKTQTGMPNDAPLHPVIRPSKRSTGASIAKFLILGSVALVGLPVLALFVWLMLGNRVDIEFGDGPREPALAFEEPVPLPPPAIEPATTPPVAEPVTEFHSDFSIELTRDWKAEGSRDFNDLEIFTWTTEDSEGQETTIEVWSVAAPEGSPTVEDIINEYSVHNGSPIDEIHSESRNGETIGIGRLRSSDQPDHAFIYVVVHAGEGGFVTGTIWSGYIENYEQKVAAYGHVLESIRYVAATESSDDGDG